MYNFDVTIFRAGRQALQAVSAWDKDNIAEVIFMRHTRDEVIKRTIQEFERLDRLVITLTIEGQDQALSRPSKTPG
jgi:hypothetical protein